MGNWKFETGVSETTLVFRYSNVSLIEVNQDFITSFNSSIIPQIGDQVSVLETIDDKKTKEALVNRIAEFGALTVKHRSIAYFKDKTMVTLFVEHHLTGNE